MSISSYSVETDAYCSKTECQFIFSGENEIECTCVSNLLIYFNVVLVLCWKDWIDPSDLIKLNLKENDIHNDTKINCSLPNNVLIWIKDEEGELKHSDFECSVENKSITDNLLNDVPEFKSIEFIGCSTSINDTLDKLKYESEHWQSNTDYISLEFKYRKKKGLQLSKKDENFSSRLINNIKDLQSLAIFSNKFNWKDHFKTLEKLKLLFLFFNNIQILNSSMFEDLADLERIYLEFGGVSKVSGNTFAKNRKLKVVDISNNKLSQLPLRLFSNLPELEVVDLSNNYLKSLPSDLFKNSPKLTTLHLDNNLFTIIPKNILGDLNKLKLLQLDYNQISIIPDDMFQYLTSFEELYLNNNNVSKLGNLQFPVPCHIKGIYLSNNKLQYLSNAPFTDCITVHKNLSSDEITMYSRMMTLLIDASNNDIRRFELLHYEKGGQQIKPVRFSLDYNNISEINIKEIEEIIKKNQSLTDNYIELNFANNIIPCDCRIEDLVKYLGRTMEPQTKNFLRLIVENVRCNYPKPLVGLSVEALNLTTLPCPAEIFGIDCPEICDCQINEKNSSIVYDCSYRNISRVPKISISNDLIKSVEVNLEANNLIEAPTKELGYNYVSKLILSNNIIQTVTWLPDNIKMLFIDHNNISFLNEDIISKLNSANITSISLDNNPWKCDCKIASFKIFRAFLGERFNFIQNYINITCNESEKPLINEDIDSLCPNFFQLIIPYIAILLGFLFLIAVAIILFYRYQLEIKTWLFIHNITFWFTNEEDEIDEEKLYDAFISYSHKDEEFVTKELLPTLEDGPRPYKFCLHYRDWIPGEFISKEIIWSVKNSRRTVIILSKNFLESVWGKMEFRTAHMQAMSEGRIRVIIILYGEINLDEVDDELKVYLKTNTYLKWNDQWFWNKLCYALPHNNRHFHNTMTRTTQC